MTKKMLLILMGAFFLPFHVAEAAQTWSTCKPVRVANYANRVHVKCAASVSGGIWYFAYPGADTATAARMLSLLSSAFIAGRTLQVLYDPADKSGAGFGCQVNDCRKLLAAEML